MIIERFGPIPVAKRAGVLRAPINRPDLTGSDVGWPWQDGFDERVNGKFLEECLGVEWLRTRAEATIVIEQ